MSVNVFILLTDEKYTPRYKSEGAACADAYACLDDSVMISPGKVAKVPLGFSIELPPQCELQIRSRSGLAEKGIMVANGIGTIDSDYRGPVSVLLYNSTDEPFFVSDGDRIAQLAVKPVEQMRFVEVKSLTQTARGDGGFGSTGK